MSETNGTHEANGVLIPHQRARTLAELREKAPAPSDVGEWARTLREAAYNAVTETDITEIVAKQMEKAKAGDRAAAKFIMDFLAGGTPKVTIIEKHVVKRTRRAKLSPPPSPPPGEMRHNPDLDELCRPAPATVPESPSLRVLRRLAARVLRADGPHPGPALATQLEVSAGELETVMVHEWFALAGGQWTLTPAGRREVG